MLCENLDDGCRADSIRERPIQVTREVTQLREAVVPHPRGDAVRVVASHLARQF